MRDAVPRPPGDLGPASAGLPGPAMRAAPEQREMALIIGLAFVLNVGIGTALEWLHLRLGLVLSQVLFIAGPAVASTRWFFLDRRRVLPLRRPPWRAFGAAILGTLGLNHLLNLLGAWQESVFPTPQTIRMFFASQFVYRGPLDFAFILVAFAIVPAVCEEMLFRGFLQSGLVRLFESPRQGVVLTALIFTLFHLDPWRFAGVFVLGLFLGSLAQTTGSLLPGMVAHALNNAVSIAQAAWSDADEPAGGLWLAPAAMLLVLASVLLMRRRASGPVPGSVL